MPQADSSPEADSKPQLVKSGVRKCIILLFASTYSMSVKILAVDQVLRCLPHHLKIDDGFEDAVSLAQATGIERSAHKTAVEYRIRLPVCLQQVEIFRRELEQTERSLGEVDRHIYALMTLAQRNRNRNADLDLDIAAAGCDL